MFWCRLARLPFSCPTFLFYFLIISIYLSWFKIIYFRFIRPPFPLPLPLFIRSGSWAFRRHVIRDVLDHKVVDITLRVVGVQVVHVVECWMGHLEDSRYILGLLVEPFGFLKWCKTENDRDLNSWLIIQVLILSCLMNVEGTYLTWRPLIRSFFAYTRVSGTLTADRL